MLFICIQVICRLLFLNTSIFVIPLNCYLVSKAVGESFSISFNKKIHVYHRKLNDTEISLNGPTWACIGFLAKKYFFLSHIHAHVYTTNNNMIIMPVHKTSTKYGPVCRCRSRAADTLFIYSFVLYVLHQFLISNAKLFGTQVEAKQKKKCNNNKNWFTESELRFRLMRVQYSTALYISRIVPCLYLSLVCLIFLFLGNDNFGSFL